MDKDTRELLMLLTREVRSLRRVVEELVAAQDPTDPRPVFTCIEMAKTYMNHTEEDGDMFDRSFTNLPEESSDVPG